MTEQEAELSNIEQAIEYRYSQAKKYARKALYYAGIYLVLVTDILVNTGL